MLVIIACIQQIQGKGMEKQKSNRRVINVIAVVPMQPPLTSKKIADYNIEIARKQQKMMLKTRKKNIRITGH